MCERVEMFAETVCNIFFAFALTAYASLPVAETSTFPKKKDIMFKAYYIYINFVIFFSSSFIIFYPRLGRGATELERIKVIFFSRKNRRFPSIFDTGCDFCLYHRLI